MRASRRGGYGLLVVLGGFVAGLVLMLPASGAAERDYEAEVRESEESIAADSSDLRASVERLAEAGGELQEVQSTLDAASGRAAELGARLEQNQERLALRESERAAAEERYREGISRAYRGEGVRDLELVLGGVISSADLLDPALRQVLFRDREDLRERERAEEAVRQTVEVISTTEEAYREAAGEERRQARRLQAELRELEAARLALEQSISRERADILTTREEQRRDRLRELAEARAERERLREQREMNRREKSPPSGEVSTGASLSGPPDAPAVAPQYVPPEVTEGPVASGGSVSERERELEVAESEILVGDPAAVDQLPREEYMRIYQEAAAQYGLADDWYVLAAIGEVESGHGQNLGPSSAGALGPMQFLPSTWVGYGVDGNGDGQADILDPEDAIPAAAGYLRASGAPGDWYAALYAYNRADWYVQKVLALSEGYRELDRQGQL